MVHGKEVNLIAHNKHLKKIIKMISVHLWLSKVKNVIYNEIIINSLRLNFRGCKQYFELEEVSDKHQLFVGCF